MLERRVILPLSCIQHQSSFDKSDNTTFMIRWADYNVNGVGLDMLFYRDRQG